MKKMLSPTSRPALLPRFHALSALLLLAVLGIGQIGCSSEEPEPITGDQLEEAVEVEQNRANREREEG
ncbi:hypothetical protein [Aeoliella mucimassa]|uniref:Uncharacterized protein n=1 Tax=Aeoliella mucimassa TaxID=2527972 RepID=A0A518AMC9_9BACT|nr:hypothetical protein [Aeoliella mucimassa]QDU55882.1 hypothetical protein Pan181_20790 [Aeoliella mucimassa]